MGLFYIINQSVQKDTWKPGESLLMCIVFLSICFAVWYIQWLVITCLSSQKGKTKDAWMYTVYSIHPQNLHHVLWGKKKQVFVVLHICICIHFEPVITSEKKNFTLQHPLILCVHQQQKQVRLRAITGVKTRYLQRLNARAPAIPSQRRNNLPDVLSLGIMAALFISTIRQGQAFYNSV